MIHAILKMIATNIKHKYFIFQAGRRMKGFDKAWEHHWKNNDHHIEYWAEKNLTFSGMNVGAEKSKDHVCAAFWMPDKAIREMVADWMAACRANDGYWPDKTNWTWGEQNLARVVKKLEATHQPETTTRGFLLEVLYKNNMISSKTYNDLLFS